MYFLLFAALQLPLGGLLDRYGPATIQSALRLVASTGALVFAFADGLTGLLVGRVHGLYCRSLLAKSELPPGSPGYTNALLSIRRVRLFIAGCG